MESATFITYSNKLQREMSYKVFGTKGKLCLALPIGGGRYFDFESNGMVATVEKLIEKGKIQLVLVDGIDTETWLAFNEEPLHRMQLHQAWTEYIIDELMPELREKSHDSRSAIIIGCDLGATNASSLFFHHPDVFDTLIGLSGIYSASPYFGDYSADLVLQNSMDHYLLKIPMGHPWIKFYRKNRIILCCGRSVQEEQSLKGTRNLDAILTRMDIPHWCDYWGEDVTHDWSWWRKQFPYFMETIL